MTRTLFALNFSVGIFTVNRPTHLPNAQKVATPVTDVVLPRSALSGQASAKTSERVYFPHLDGLRFWAFFAVFLAHSFVSHNPVIKASPVHQFIEKWKIAGTLGVNFFFVLSGFLITYLLLVEHQKCGHIDVRAFWLRRALRIWPLYFACVAATYIVQPARSPGETTIPIGYFLAFVSNFLPAHGTYYYGPLGVMWSISVEEQFYVFWPLLFTAFVSHRLLRQPQWLFAALCAFSVGFSLWYHDAGLSYRHTLAQVVTLALGGWAAWHSFHNTRLLHGITHLSRRFIIAFYLALIVAIIIYNQWQHNGWVAAVGRPILGALFAFVILEQCYALNSFYKCGNQRWLSTLGRYTYGLYCLQFFAIIAVEKLMLRFGNPSSLPQMLFLQTPLALAVNIMIAALSFHLLEQPFLRLKRRFAHIQTT